MEGQVNLQLFTVISLVIGLAVAAYTAIRIIRPGWEAKIYELTLDGKRSLKTVEFSKGTRKYSLAKFIKQTIEWLSFFWKCLLAIPNVAYCIFILGIALYIVWQPTPFEIEARWDTYRWIIIIILILNVGSLFVALLIHGFLLLCRLCMDFACKLITEDMGESLKQREQSVANESNSGDVAPEHEENGDDIPF